jgi:hypothetical protein
MATAPQLRVPLTSFIGRETEAADHRHCAVEIGEHSCREQAGHAAPQHNRVLTNRRLLRLGTHGSSIGDRPTRTIGQMAQTRFRGS